MHYLLLIHHDEATLPPDGSPECREGWEAYRAYTDHLLERGVYEGANALRGTDTASTVRVRGDEVLVTDGPYAETKEQLGGYFLIDCADLDEALELAARCPGAAQGAVEVRPVHPGP